jgi:hypothetical protein
MAVQADNTPGGDHAFMQALVETEGLMAAFSGHCHRIDWYVFLLLLPFLP